VARYGVDDEVNSCAALCLPSTCDQACGLLHPSEAPSIKKYLKKWQSQRNKFDLLHAELPEKELRLRDVRACFQLSFDNLGRQGQRLLAHMQHGRDAIFLLIT